MKHSTEEIELIREYFNLSNSQMKDPDKINISKDLIASDETLLSIEELGRLNTEKLESTQIRIVGLEKLKATNNSKISSLTNEMSLIDRELEELDKSNRLRERQRRRNSITTESPGRDSRLPLKTKLESLRSIIKKDIAFFLSIVKGQFVRIKKDFIIAATTYLAIPLIALIIYKIFLNLRMEDFLVNLYFTTIWILCFVLICLLVRYIQKKLEIIDDINSRLWRFNQSLSQKAKLTINSGIAFANILEGKDSIRKILMLRYSELLNSSNGLKIIQENIEYELKNSSRRVILLTQSILEDPFKRDRRIQEIRIQETKRQEDRLSYLKEIAQNLLCKDIEMLTQCVMNDLKIEIKNTENLKRQNVMQTSEPILVLKGVSKISHATSEGTLIESDSEINLSKNNQEVLDKNGILMQSSDFVCDLEEKTYGVYEFLSIFLCANFITYYRCYFNFITGVPVNEESCEYMYDSIISVKVQERSSNRLRDESKKRVYGKRLVLTTGDGKAFRFVIAKNPKLNLATSIRLSDVDQVAQEVRNILREHRRIDFTYTLGLD